MHGQGQTTYVDIAVHMSNYGQSTNKLCLNVLWYWWHVQLIFFNFTQLNYKWKNIVVMTLQCHILEQL
jgi:hypothetical protein